MALEPVAVWSTFHISLFDTKMSYPLRSNSLLVPLIQFCFFLSFSLFVLNAYIRWTKLQARATDQKRKEEKKNGEGEALCFGSWDLPWSLVLVQAPQPS